MVDFQGDQLAILRVVIITHMAAKDDLGPEFFLWHALENMAAKVIQKAVDNDGCGGQFDHVI